MYISELTDGSLQMVATHTEQQLAKRLLRTKFLNGYAQEAAFIAQVLKPLYEQTSPASIGALTDAPCITNGISAWGFMNYQVESFLERLSQGKDVIWSRG